MTHLSTHSWFLYYILFFNLEQFFSCRIMGSRVYIGRLPYHAREKDVERFFRGYGRIREINLKNGFGFVVSIILTIPHQFFPHIFAAFSALLVQEGCLWAAVFTCKCLCIWWKLPVLKCCLVIKEQWWLNGHRLLLCMLDIGCCTIYCLQLVWFDMCCNVLELQTIFEGKMR